MIVLYDNDLSEVVQFFVEHFADNVKLQRRIRGPNDQLARQSDLASLEDSAETWKMKFKPQKRQALYVWQERLAHTF